MWDEYKVKIRFTGRLCGSVPMSKELVPIWLKSRMPKNAPDDSRPIEEIEKEVLDSIEESEEKTTLGFQKNGDGYFVRGGTIKAHLKDCANQIKDAIKPKIKAFRAKVANKVYVNEYCVYITRDGKNITETDGTFEQPVHVMTMQGPRNALKVINYIEKAELVFTIRILNDKEIGIEQIKQIFEYGSIHGYGGERGMGEGRYNFEIM